MQEVIAEFHGFCGTLLTPEQVHNVINNLNKKKKQVPTYLNMLLCTINGYFMIGT